MKEVPQLHFRYWKENIDRSDSQKETSKTSNFARDKKLNCIQLCLMEIADYMNVPYEYIFLETWLFDLERIVNLGEIYDKSYIPLNERMISLLCKYTKVNCRNIDKTKFANKIEKLEVNDVALVEMDTFDCPWSPGYMWKHFSYYYLLIRISEDNNKYLGFCPYDDIYDIHINNELLEISQNIYIFSKSKENGELFFMRDLKKHLNKKVILSEGKTIFSKIREFATFLKNLENLDQVFMEKRLDDNLYVQRIAYIVSSRFGLVLMMDKLVDDELINSTLNEVYLLWLKIKSNLIKAILTNNIQDLRTLSRDIINAADGEEKVYQLIQSKNDSLICGEKNSNWR